MLNPAHNQRGVGLVETLVAIVVLSIGLLGLAGLVTSGLKDSHSSGLKIIAAQQAYDMADRMRANRAGVNAGNYNFAATPIGAQVRACYTASGCTTTDIAQSDAWDWDQQNAALLPDGRGIVCVDSTPDDGSPTAPLCDNAPNAPYAIKVWWDRRNGDTERERYAVSVQP